MSKTYENVSPVEQLGIAPGETGEADISEDQEQRMVERGAIKVVGGSHTHKDTTEQEESE